MVHKYFHQLLLNQSQENTNGHTLENAESQSYYAKKVVLATNGYTPKGFHSLVNNKSLPVLSQVIVTQPLTDEQLADHKLCNL